MNKLLIFSPRTGLNDVKLPQEGVGRTDVLGPVVVKGDDGLPPSRLTTR